MKKHRTTHFMSSIYMIIFVALFLIITGRFMYIQATGEVSGVQLSEWADKQRTASYTMNSERGKIYDKNGMVLAYDRPTYRMYAILDEAYSENAEEPLHVSNAEETAKKLAPLLGVEEEEIQEPIQNGLDNNRFQVEFGKFGKQISKQVKDEIEDLNIPGINFEEEPMRYYPNGMFASHIIGFAREEEKETDEGVEHTITGVTGMEDVMNDILGGKDGYISYQRDLYNKKLLDPSEVIQLPEDGDDIYLTIDQKIQTLLEDVMTQADEKYNPTKMNAIIMDPKSGEIVAMSSRPSYDPNNPTDVENWYNDPISTPFEPGSTMKIFTWAAAIEEGVYNGSEGFKSGTYQPNEKIRAIGDHNNGEGWGTISYDEGFERSSNVAASKLLWEKLDSESYYEYLQAFGFEEPTGIDLPGEAVGKISYNWPSDKLRTAFGQSSTVTPIQQMKAASAIVNGGKMVKPYVVDKVVDSTSGDTISETEQEYVGQPISEETAEQMKKLMSSVVNGEHGTGKPYQLEDYMVGGKTGTAEIPNPDGGGYLQGRENYVFSFMGMAPIDDPQLMVYVSIQQPELEPDESGSTPLSFIFKNVVENSLHYMDINPEKNEAPDIQQMEMPDVVNKSTSEVEEEMTETGLNTIVVGEGSKVVSSSIEAGASVLPNEKVILITDEPTMPDIKGWSLREVMTLANLLDLQVESFGSGYVTTQNIDVGNPLQSGDYLGVELEGPSSTDDEEESSEEENENEEETGEDESE